MIHKKETDSFIFNIYISIGNPGLEHHPERVLEQLDFDPKNPTAPKSLFIYLFYCWLHMVRFHHMQSMVAFGFQSKGTNTLPECCMFEIIDDGEETRES